MEVFKTRPDVTGVLTFEFAEKNIRCAMSQIVDMGTWRY